jgi:hypothetical protein
VAGVGQPAAANTAAGDLQARTEQVVLFDDTAIASAAQFNHLDQSLTEKSGASLASVITQIPRINSTSNDS